MVASDRLPLRPPITGPARIIPFPVLAKVRFVERLTAAVAALGRDRGEQHLEREMLKYRAAMMKAGLDAGQCRMRGAVSRREAQTGDAS
jgi:hypothetical protein